MIANANIWGALRDKVDSNLWDLVSTTAPTNGTSGSGAGIAGPGSTLTVPSTSTIYVNVGTRLSPTWEIVASPGSNYGLGNFRIARAHYDFAVDGGAIGTFTPAQTAALPSKAIIAGGVIDVITPFTTSASGTMGIGTSAGSSNTSIKAQLAAASYTGLVAVVPLYTAATMVKLTAAGNITCTIATGALTAGKANIILAYYIGT